GSRTLPGPTIVHYRWCTREELMHRSLPCLALCVAVPALAQRAPADLVLRGGKVYTADDRQPRADAVAVHGGRILFVGSDADVQAYIGPRTRVVDLAGATVVPGLTD